MSRKMAAPGESENGREEGFNALVHRALPVMPPVGPPVQFLTTRIRGGVRVALTNCEPIFGSSCRPVRPRRHLIRLWCGYLCPHIKRMRAKAAHASRARILVCSCRAGPTFFIPHVALGSGAAAAGLPGPVPLTVWTDLFLTIERWRPRATGASTCCATGSRKSRRSVVGTSGASKQTD
jgi:hypothetical protein